MKTILINIFLLLSLTVYSQEKFNSEKFLNTALENYASAHSMHLEVMVNLYEKGSDKKHSSFKCISKKSGNNSYLRIRNTDLIVVDSLRLFVDHNNKYMQLQKISHVNNQNNPIDFVDQIKKNTKKFIAVSKIEHTNLYTIFKNNQKSLGISISYFFNNQTLLLEKIENRYINSDASYEKIEMIYKTNLNENNEFIEVNVEDYITVHNSKIVVTDTYKDYEFVNQFKNE